MGFWVEAVHGLGEGHQGRLLLYLGYLGRRDKETVSNRMTTPGFSDPLAYLTQFATYRPLWELKTLLAVYKALGFTNTFGFKRLGRLIDYFGVENTLWRFQKHFGV